METGSTTAGLGLAAAGDRVDGYIASCKLDGLVATYALTEDFDGRITLRCTTFALDIIPQLATARDVLAALDLAESSTAENERLVWQPSQTTLARPRG